MIAPILLTGGAAVALLSIVTMLGMAAAAKADGKNGSVAGKRVAILSTEGFEQAELTEPRKALDQAGAKTTVVSPKSGTIRGWNHTDWGDSVKVD